MSLSFNCYLEIQYKLKVTWKKHLNNCISFLFYKYEPRVMIDVTFHKLLFFPFLVLLINVLNLIINSTSSFVSGKGFGDRLALSSGSNLALLSVVIISQTSDTFQWRAF